MHNNIAISVKNLGKCYQLYDKPYDRLKQALFSRIRQPLTKITSAIKQKNYHKEFWALRDVSFEVKKGEALGIIGVNGSGKSTLLQLISGTLTPTCGEININGRVGALLELGAGFNPEFTGRENVYMSGAILGLTQKEIEAKFNEIIEFADIGEFLDQPVKTYSSGMFVRLAFAVQACIEPDILIVDEALAVGDIFFQQKCHDHMAKLLERGTVIILVTHDMAVIEKYCDKAVLLNRGDCLFVGNANEAVERYYQINNTIKQQKQIKNQLDEKIATLIVSEQSIIIADPRVKKIEKASLITDIRDWPSRDAFLNLDNAILVGDVNTAKCTGIALCNESGEATTIFEVASKAYFYYEFEVLKEINVPTGGVLITDKMNINIHGKHSGQYLLKAPAKVVPGMKIRFRQTIELSILPGEYVFQVGLAAIPAEDYILIGMMPHMEFSLKAIEILRIRQAGKFLVTEKKQGVKFPFHGIADLQGEFTLSLITH